MVESSAERRTEWGSIRAGSESSVRAYDVTGKCFSFWPAADDEWLYALDVENRRSDCSGFVSSALGSSGLSSWVEVEVAAKLTNTPAHLVLRQFLMGQPQAILQAHGIEFIRIDTPSHWIAVGRRRRPLVEINA